MKHVLFLFVLVFLFTACQRNLDLYVQPPELPPTPIDLKVFLESDVLLTKDKVKLSLKVEGGVATKLELFLDDKRLTNFNPTTFASHTNAYDFIWDSTTSTEGLHSLKVHAWSENNKVFSSQALSVRVDRTAPRLTNASLDSELRYTDLTRLIELSFSEPVNGIIMNDSSLLLTKTQGAVIPKVFNCENDKVTLHLLEPVTAPASLKLELVVSDKAGNELKTSLLWDLAEREVKDNYQLLEPSSPLRSGAPKERPVRIASDQAGHLAVVWLDGEQLHVKVHTANEWQVLPTPISYEQNFRPAIALLPNGNPVIAWETRQEELGASSNVNVALWNGSSWTDLGKVNTPERAAAAPSIAVSHDGHIFIAWLEQDGHSQNVYVKHWTGSSWKALGDKLDVNASQNASFPTLILDKQEQPYVAWREDRAEDFAWTVYVKHWDGANWHQLGQGLNVNPYERADMPAIALDEHNLPVLAWSEYDVMSASNNIYVKRWTGAAWQALGAAVENLIEERSVYPTIAISQNQVITVSWWGYTTDQNEVVEAAKWFDDEWHPQGALNKKLTAQAFYPTLSLRGASEIPVLAWLERLDGEASIVVWQAE